MEENTYFKGVIFSLAPGESLGIIGPSAAGKSTWQGITWDMAGFTGESSPRWSRYF